MALTEQLDDVIAKTRHLIELCAVLQEENELLKQENQSLRSDIQSGENSMVSMQEQLRAMAVARTLNDSGVLDSEVSEKTLDIKQKINEFVREIDKCIALLKK